MSVSYGFYNSYNHDRVYSALQVGQIFDGIIQDGVYATIGKAFQLRVSSGMDIVVGAGRAWFNNTWTYNDSDIVITLTASDLLLPRIDSIIIEVNETDRTNSIYALTGTPSASPVPSDLTNTDSIHQYLIGTVYVAAEVTAINNSNIYYNVGNSTCPFVTGILQTITTDELIAQWYSQWTEWLENKDTTFNEWQTDLDEEFHTWLSDTDDAWNIWFENVQAALSEDVAGHLYLLITELQDGKQDLLTAGSNITISDSNVISATDTTYTAGTNITISDDNVISATDTTYTAGTNITISSKNVISAVDTKYTAGTGLSLSSGNVFSLATSGVTAGTYGPGANVTGSNGTTISVPQITVNSTGQITSIVNRTLTNVNTDTNTTYSAGSGLSLSGTTFSHTSSITAGTVGGKSSTSGATITIPYITYNNTGHITATGTITHTVNKIGTATVGGTAKPIYLSGGSPVACSATVGNASTPVYMNSGTLIACSSLLKNTTLLKEATSSGNISFSSGLENYKLIHLVLMSTAGSIVYAEKTMSGQALAEITFGSGVNMHMFDVDVNSSYKVIYRRTSNATWYIQTLTSGCKLRIYGIN